MKNAIDISASTDRRENLQFGEYFYHARAIAPFVIWARIGHKCAPLCGFGRKGIFLWIPELFPPIVIWDSWHM